MMPMLTTAIIAKEALSLMKHKGVTVAERDQPRRQSFVTFDGPPPYMPLDEYSTEVLWPIIAALVDDLGGVSAPSPILQVPAGMDGYVARYEGLAVRIISRSDIHSGKLCMRADVMGYA